MECVAEKGQIGRAGGGIGRVGGGMGIGGGGGEGGGGGGGGGGRDHRPGNCQIIEGCPNCLIPSYPSRQTDTNDSQ